MGIMEQILFWQKQLNGMAILDESYRFVPMPYEAGFVEVLIIKVILEIDLIFRIHGLSPLIKRVKPDISIYDIYKVGTIGALGRSSSAKRSITKSPVLCLSSFVIFFLQQLFFSFTVRVAENASFYDESKGLSRRAFFFW